MANPIDPWFLDNLVCPVDHSPLIFSAGNLVSSAGRKYPVIDGIPVMLRDDVEQTMSLCLESLKRARGESAGDPRNPDLYLESLGVSETEKSIALTLATQGNSKIDPVVSVIIGATSGYSYQQLIGKLETYPIPELRLPPSKGETFLDIGCNWGRWSIAAARKGYTVIGADPSLGAIMAARRVAQQNNLTIKYVVADARFLPFRKASIDVAFSYSVLQHLSKENVRLALSAVAYSLKPGGKSLIQMPNFLGIRSLQHQLRRRFREAQGFEVRYWSIPELKAAFSDAVGKSTVSVDCYFGLGLQKSDIGIMSTRMKRLINLSEFLRSLSKTLGFMVYVADSLYVSSTRSD